MLISCEKCTTTYVLDETLIPASGAAVQCTRCSHVFTAFPPKPDTQQTVLEEEPTTTRRRPNAAAPGIPQGRPANQTIIFGAQGAAAPAAPAPQSRPANQTMVFGSVQGAPAQAPAAQPQPPAGRAANQTMVFGTPAGQQLATAPAAAPSAPANQTLVFGHSPVAPAPKEAGPKQTVAFGTPAGQAAAAREPAPVAPAANQTAIFGQKPPVANAAAVNQTMMFGTPSGQQLATGQAPAAAPAPAANQTLVFGAQPPVDASPKSTQMFGAPQPAGAKPGTSTMMFGKPPEVAAPGPTKTMAFGVQSPSAKPAKLPQVTPGTVELSGEGEPEQRSESTVRVDLERMMREHDEGDAPPERHDQTQRFAMTEPNTPGEGSESVQDRHNRTALFAMSTLQETTKPDAKAPGRTSPELVGVAEPTVGMDATMPPDNATIPARATASQFGFGGSPDDPPGVSTLLEPGDMKATIRHDGPIASTLPNLPPISPDATNAAHRNPLRLDLISEPGLSPVGPVPLEASLAPSTDVQNDAAVEAIAAQGRRRSTIAIVVVVLLVLAVALGVLWQLFGRQLTSQNVDPRLREAVAQSLEKFRREQFDVRKQELARLEQIVKETPTFAEAHAALVIGLSLQYDDLHAERAVLAHRYDALLRQRAQVKDAAKANELVKSINAIAEQAGKYDAALIAARERLDRSVRAMDAAVGSASGATARARTFAHVMMGGRFDGDDGNDFWLKLAPPVELLTSLERPDAGDARSELEAAEKQLAAITVAEETAAFPRPHFVRGRVFLALGDEPKGREAFKKAVELEPQFEASRTSLEILDQR